MQQIFKFSQTYNFRELGGYPTQDQRQIRSHKILRAAYLTQLTASELQQLHNYGLRYIIDLRSDYERQQWPDPKADFLTYIHLPLYAQNIDDHLYQILPYQDKYDNLPGIYQQVVLDPIAQKVFQQFFQILLHNDQPRHSVVFHCSAGKDRTGIIAILFLFLMQVPQAYITQDYLLSNLMYQNKIDLSSLNNSNNQTIKKMNFTQADHVIVKAINRAILRTYNSWNNFQKQVLGLSPADYHKLRKIYTQKLTK